MVELSSGGVLLGPVFLLVMPFLRVVRREGVECILFAVPVMRFALEVCRHILILGG
jgi:hypothetical protein